MVDRVDEAQMRLKHVFYAFHLYNALVDRVDEAQMRLKLHAMLAAKYGGYRG